MQGGIPREDEWALRGDADLLTFSEESATPEGLEGPNFDAILDPGHDAAPDPELDNAILEFVDLLNAGDLDGLAELVAADVQCDLVGARSAVGIVEGMEELLFRHPDLIATRGDVERRPIAALWLLDADEDRYRLVGGLAFDLDVDGRIACVDYVEELPEDDAVIEVPDDSERPEWQDWAAHDEG